MSVSPPITVRAEHLSELEARIVCAIVAYRAANGSGPAWHLLGRGSGLDEHHALPELLWRLKRAGLITFSRTRRSIAVPREALELAIERLGGEPAA